MPKFYSSDLNSPLSLAIQQDFSGGQYSDFNPTRIIENGVAAAENCILNKIGELETRRAYVESATTSLGAIECIAGLNTYSVNGAVVFAGGSTMFWNGSYLVSLSGYTFDDGNNSVVAVQHGNKLYAVDGVNGLYYFDGENWTLNESPDTNPCPDGMEIIFSHQQRLIAYGETFKREGFLVSDINLNDVPEFDQNLWSFDIANDGSKITAACSWFGSYFAAFKRNKTYVVNAAVDAESAAEYTIDIADNNIGCVAKKTAVTLNGEVYFLSDYGVHKLTNLSSDSSSQFVVTPSISTPINNIISRIRKDKIHLCHAEARGNRYILYLPITGLYQSVSGYVYLTDEDGNILTDYDDSLIYVDTISSSDSAQLDPANNCNLAIVWNTTMNGGRGAWEGYWVGDNISSLSVTEINGISYLLAGDTDGVLYTNSDYKQDDEVGVGDYATQSSVTTRAFDFGEMFNEKRPRHVEIYIKQNFGQEEQVKLKASVDGGSWKDIRTFDTPSGGFTIPFTIPLYIPISSYIPLKAGIQDIGRVKDIAFRIISTSGRMNLREVSSAAFVKTMKKDSNIAST